MLLPKYKIIMLRLRKDETRDSSTKSLAPILIVVASSISSSSTFTKELRHLNPTLGQHIHQLWHDITIPFRVDEAGRLPQISNSTSSTDPVYILVHIIRHVIVDDMGNIGDVKPSSSHCSRHQDWLVSCAEIEQCFLPLSLKPVPMDTGSWQALSREVGGEEVGVLLGLHKDQSSLLGVALRVLHQLLQLRTLVELGNLVEHLLHITA